MSTITSLIESDAILLGKSASGIEARTPDALGISRSTREVICDETNFWVPTVPLNRKSATTDVVIVLFLMMHRMYMPCTMEARQDMRRTKLEMRSIPPPQKFVVLIASSLPIDIDVI